MLNNIRVIIYLVLVSFFTSVIYNAFLFSKGIALYQYLFDGIGDGSIIQLIIYYIIKSVPAIIMNFFVVWVMRNVLDIERPWIVMPFYILMFLASETLFFYFVNRPFFTEHNNIYHYLISFGVYSVSLWSLTFSSYSLSNYSEEENEKTNL